MPSTNDEVYGPDGQLQIRFTRTIAEEYPLKAEIYETRKQVKAIAVNPTVPGWGRVLAKMLLLLTHYLVAERATEDSPTETGPNGIPGM